MIDLGWTLGWMAVQVTIVLVPAIGLHALASRRGPTSGAWVATLSLAMVVVLAALAFLPTPGAEVDRLLPIAPISSTGPSAEVAKLDPPGDDRPTDRSRATADRGRPFARIRLAWSRFERQSAGSVAMIRPWGKAFAVLGFAGSGFGLLRLAIGLWAVGLCRRRSDLVDDRDMIALVEELRVSMGCRRAVELREVPDLTTPATAGWLRPMLLLPGNWSEWDDSERRAVVAHELAHIVRGDYAAGLLARVAVTLNFFHPMVRWMAGRLHLEQELAADAMGARFAGGRSSYLLALSRLALEQDGRPASWPARAFLPSRGTLIRRIAMLKNESESTMTGQAWSKAMRLAMALGLLVLTVVVASWRAPALAQEYKLGTIDVHGEARRTAPVAPTSEAPFEMIYIPEEMPGAVAFRPAAIARRVGIDVLKPLIREGLGGDLPMLAKKLGVDMSRPGFVKLGIEDIESITGGLKIGLSKGKPTNEDGEKLHTIEFRGLTVRTVAPFDWPGFFRQWTMELEEVREARGVYYKVKDPAKAELFMGCVLYQPDNRTLVFESETRVKQLIARETPSSPTYLRGADWDRVSRGLVAVALNNQGDSFAKSFDLGRPDDKVALQLFSGIDRWVLGAADADAISLIAEATARDPKSAEAVSRSIEVLAKLGLKAMGAVGAPGVDLTGTNLETRVFRLCKGLLEALKPEQVGPSVALRIENVGTIADVLAIIQMESAGKEAEAKAKEAKAAPKAEKR